MWDTLYSIFMHFFMCKCRKMDVRIQETTFVHQVFGGYTCSSVTCTNCKYSSRTYEAILDLSLEISSGVSSIEQALARFTAEETLSGANKYNCEKYSSPATSYTNYCDLIVVYLDYGNWFLPLDVSRKLWLSSIWKYTRPLKSFLFIWSVSTTATMAGPKLTRKFCFKKHWISHRTCPKQVLYTSTKSLIY